MSGTYYCHECECRRFLTPISTCAVCGCCYIEEIPVVVEEEEDMMTDYDEELDLFYIHEEQEDDEEELLEERCLYEQMSSIYNHPIAANFDNDSINEERQRIDELLSSITDGGEEVIDDDNIVAYDVRFEQRASNHTTADESTTSTTSRFQLPFARIGRLLETFYESISDDENEDETRSYSRRSFLDNLADILSDYTQDIETTTQPSRSIDGILSALKKKLLLANDPDVEDECIICQDAFGTTLEIFHLPCNHKFHGECITRWLNIKTSCPVCRQNVGNDEQEEETDLDDILENNDNTTSSLPISIMLQESIDRLNGSRTTEQQHVEEDFGSTTDNRYQRYTARRNQWLSSSPSNYQLNAPPPTFNHNYGNDLYSHVYPHHTDLDDMDWTLSSNMEEVD